MSMTYLILALPCLSGLMYRCMAECPRYCTKYSLTIPEVPNNIIQIVVQHIRQITFSEYIHKHHPTHQPPPHPNLDGSGSF